MPLPPPTAGPAPNEPGVSAVGSGGGPVQLPAAKPGKGTAPVTVLFTVQPWGAATPMMDDMLCICAREPLSAPLLWGQAGLDVIFRRTYVVAGTGDATLAALRAMAGPRAMHELMHCVYAMFQSPCAAVMLCHFKQVEQQRQCHESSGVLKASGLQIWETATTSASPRSAQE